LLIYVNVIFPCSSDIMTQVEKRIVYPKLASGI
jgi:hypothetical protein